MRLRKQPKAGHLKPQLKVGKLALLGITGAEVEPHSLSVWLSWATQVQLYKAWGWMLSFPSTLDTHSFLYISSSKHKAIKMDGLSSALLISCDCTDV